MIKVGLTGNFGSGHQDIVNHFYKSGTPVFDADLLLKFFINHKKDTKHKIKEAFGPNTYAYGTLNILKFDTDKKFSKLINVITPEIFSAYEKFRQKNHKYPYTVFLSSILFEKSWNLYMNYNINVFKPDMIRKKWLLSNTHIDIGMIEHILENEMCERDKNIKSNFVIHNYGENNVDFKIKNEIYQVHSSLVRHFQKLDYEKTF
jgi:dephospho-CoA kinase